MDRNQDLKVARLLWLPSDNGLKATDIVSIIFESCFFLKKNNKFFKEMSFKESFF